MRLLLKKQTVPNTMDDDMLAFARTITSICRYLPYCNGIQLKLNSMEDKKIDRQTRVLTRIAMIFALSGILILFSIYPKP